MAVVLIHNWWEQPDIDQNIIPRMHSIFNKHILYLRGNGCHKNFRRQIIVKKLKGTEKLIVKINKIPYPRLFIFLMNYDQLIETDDSVFIVDGKQIKLGYDIEEVDWIKQLKKESLELVKKYGGEKW